MSFADLSFLHGMQEEIVMLDDFSGDYGEDLVSDVATLDDLPQELLMEIISFFPCRYDELVKLRSLSKSWQSLFEEGVLKCIFPDDAEFTMRISERDFKILTHGYVNKPWCGFPIDYFGFSYERFLEERKKMQEKFFTRLRSFGSNRTWVLKIKLSEENASCRSTRVERFSAKGEDLIRTLKSENYDEVEKIKRLARQSDCAVVLRGCCCADDSFSGMRRSQRSYNCIESCCDACLLLHIGSPIWMSLGLSFWGVDFLFFSIVELVLFAACYKLFERCLYIRFSPKGRRCLRRSHYCTCCCPNRIPDYEEADDPGCGLVRVARQALNGVGKFCYWLLCDDKEGIEPPCI